MTDTLTAPKMTVADFAGRVKQKYPDYADMRDDELAARMTNKFPEYKDQIDWGPAGPPHGPVSAQVIAGAKAQLSRPTTMNEKGQDITYDNPKLQGPFKEDYAGVGGKLRALGQEAKGILNVPKAIVSAIAAPPSPEESAVAATGVPGAVGGFRAARIPVELAKGSAEAAGQTFNAIRAGEPVAAAAHMVEINPVIGPMIRAAREKSAAGKPLEALGEGLTNAALMKVGEKPAAAAGEAVPSVVEQAIKDRSFGNVRTGNAQAAQKITSSLLGETAARPNFEDTLARTLPLIKAEMGDLKPGATPIVQRMADAARKQASRQHGQYEAFVAPDKANPISVEQFQPIKDYIDSVLTDPTAGLKKSTVKQIEALKGDFDQPTDVAGLQKIHERYNDRTRNLYKMSPEQRAIKTTDPFWDVLDHVRGMVADTLYDNLSDPRAIAAHQLSGGLGEVANVAGSKAIELRRAVDAGTAPPSPWEVGEVGAGVAMGNPALATSGVLRYGARRIAQSVLKSHPDVEIAKALEKFQPTDVIANARAEAQARAERGLPAGPRIGESEFPAALTGAPRVGELPQRPPAKGAAEPAIPTGYDTEMMSKTPAAEASGLPAEVSSAISPTPRKAPVTPGEPVTPRPAETANRGQMLRNQVRGVQAANREKAIPVETRNAPGEAESAAAFAEQGQKRGLNVGRLTPLGRGDVGTIGSKQNFPAKPAEPINTTSNVSFLPPEVQAAIQKSSPALQENLSNLAEAESIPATSGTTKLMGADKQAALKAFDSKLAGTPQDPLRQAKLKTLVDWLRDPTLTAEHANRIQAELNRRVALFPAEKTPKPVKE